MADVRRDRCDEEWGDAPTIVRGSLHGPLPGGGSYDLNKSFQVGPDLSADYREYAIEWAPNSVKFFIDDIEYASLVQATFTAAADGPSTASRFIS